MRVLQAFCLHLLRRASVRWSLWSLAKYTLYTLHDTLRDGAGPVTRRRRLDRMCAYVQYVAAPRGVRSVMISSRSRADFRVRYGSTSAVFLRAGRISVAPWRIRVFFGQLRRKLTFRHPLRLNSAL